MNGIGNENGAPVRCGEWELVQEIDKKGEENNRRILALRGEKEKAIESGQNVSEIYNQAEIISLENEKLVKAWFSLLDQFTVTEDAVKSHK